MRTLGDEATVKRGVVSRSRPVDDVSYRAFLEAFDAPRIYWTTPEGAEVVGVGATARLRAGGPGRFETVRSGADRLFETVDHDGPAETRPRMFGGVSFFDDHRSEGVWSAFAPAEFVLPQVQLTRGDAETWLTVTDAGREADVEDVEVKLGRVTDRVVDLPAMRSAGGPPGVVRERVRTSRDEWMNAVRAAVEHIETNELRKVTLATAMDVDLAEAVDVPDLLERLRRTYPSCFRFLIAPEDGANFFGAPPERLVSRSGRTVHTEALAGSVPRGNTPEEDEALAGSLRDSKKLQHEQGLVATVIQESLSPFSTVTERDQEVRKLATIQHLRTPIEARLDEDVHVLTLVEALHPTPAVGGVPLDRALDTIRQTETFDRGWYAAPVGWFDADGDGDFAVGIRSAAGGNRRLTLFAGNGIVDDSDPADEWEEVNLKWPVRDELEPK
jgi:menaquinone-specific isochorismate synthase